MKRWKKCSAYISLGTVIEDSLLLKRFIESGIHLLPVFQLYLCSHVLLPSPEQNCCLPSWMTNKKKMWLLVLIVPLKLHFHIPVCTASLISLEKFCNRKKQGSWWVWATPETDEWWRMDLSVTFNFTVLAIQMRKVTRIITSHGIHFIMLKMSYDYAACVISNYFLVCIGGTLHWSLTINLICIIMSNASHDA